MFNVLREFFERNLKLIIVAAGMFFFITAGYMATSFQYQAPKNERPANAAAKTEPAELVKPAAPEPDKKENEAAALEVNAAVTADDEVPGEWMLYITGEVRKPGVYKVPAGSRLVQLVDAAGGLTMIADPTAINLAAFIEDGMHIHVPGKGDKEQAYMAYIGVTALTGLSPTGQSTSVTSPSPGLPSTGLPVDVNRASAEELTALKGIGPALAGRIVEYRLSNGRFRKVEDLLRVRGIGRKTLDQFRDSVVIRP